MAIVTYVSRRMADAECVGHVKRGIPGVGSQPGSHGREKSTGVSTDDVISVWQNRGTSDPDPVKLREGKVMVPHDELQGVRGNDGARALPGSHGISRKSAVQGRPDDGSSCGD